MYNMLSEDITSLLEGGITGTFPSHQTHAMLVGPSTSNEFNTVKAGIIPVACWRLDDIRFEFDSSFVYPTATEELKQLSILIREHPGAPLSIFGHADPVGNDDYNKQLSGRRAEAIYALLIRDTALWERLYKNPFGGDNWGLKAIQTMLKTLGHDPGPIDGVMGNQTQAAVKAFQRANRLTEDGDPGPATREKLFQAYMDAICQDKNGQPFQMQKSDFLAQGADPDGKGDYQGCSEFNPVLLLSEQENQKLSQSSKQRERNAANAPNRRVMVLLFRPGSKVIPERWPCPRAREGVAGCKKRFWSDGEQRRSHRLPSERRTFEKTEDTFACRFYHRLVTSSPCERLAVDGVLVKDELGDPVTNYPVECVLSDGSIVQTVTDVNGVIKIAGKQIMEIRIDDIHLLI